MYRIIFLIILIDPQPISAQTQSVQIITDLAFFSKEFLGVKNKYRDSSQGMAKLDLKYDKKKLSSQLSLNYKGNEKYTLDGSYLQYTSGITTFGVGSIVRHWSFSNNESLILSQNAHPTESIYLKLMNNFRYNSLPSETNWSLEAFAGFTEGSLNDSRSIISGARAILTPIEGLSFELVQTSQWGGKGYSTGMSAIGSALFLDSNAGVNANINKMAGFGVSYTMRKKKLPLRVYGQAIGEDEAGSLPSCYAYLAGLEWTNVNIKYPTIVGIETLDTRTNATTHGNCGSNTMYNNNIYQYTNYGKVMGAAIDTEGTSLGLYVRSQISQKINIEFATKSVVINDNNTSDHRLSSNRQTGLINSLSVSWVKNNINFNGDIFYQDFNLDKANIRSGYGVGFSSSIKF